MVRHYKRKKEKTYTELQILKAVDDVKNNRLTSRQAADLYGVPRTTINTRLKCVHDAPGRPTVFSADIEMRIANNLHIMEKHGFPLSRKEALVLIAEYVRQNGIYTPFSNDMPGKDWFYGFQKRNNLSFKKPQLLEMARRNACDPFTVYGYFEMLEKVMEELGLQDKPQQIYNLDETSICNDPIKGKLVGKKGYPSTRTTSGPGRNNTTVLLATNACGEKVPPLIIFQGKHLWSEWLYPNENVKTAFAVSEKGWIETTIFEKYLRETFVPAIGDKRPALLIFDGHSTHVDLSVIEYAASAGITIVKLPPQSSHILQPLDCSTMKPLKDRWEDEIIKWQRLHVGAKLPKPEFARLITKVWDEMNPIILQNGFRKTGAYPVNPEAIRKELFDFTLLQKWETFKTQQVQQHEPKTEYIAENNNMTEVPCLISSALDKIDNKEPYKPDKKQDPRSNHKEDELKTNHEPNTEQKRRKYNEKL